jgi:hypothetical protein
MKTITFSLATRKNQFVFRTWITYHLGVCSLAVNRSGPMAVSLALNAVCPSTTTIANRFQLVFSPVCYPHS